MRRYGWVVLVALIAAACAEGSDVSPASEPPASAVEVDSAKDFSSVSFSEPLTIDNPWLPMVPGTRMTWEGQAFDEGEKILRRVVFTVTDMAKEIDGINTVVALDIDYNDGDLGEQELAFFAQDDGGNVWHFGQYPEEYEDGEIAKTPTWIHGFEGALAGLSMKAAPGLDSPSYAQGWGPQIGWDDRAQVDAMGVQTCTPVDCYADVLVMREFSLDEPGAAQLKYYAMGVGNVRVGWRGPNEEEREEMVLVSIEVLTPEEMSALRETVLAQEQRAYEYSPDVYGKTPPMTPA